MNETLGPYTRAFISLVEDHPERPAADAKLLGLLDDDTPADATAIVRALAHRNAAMLTLGSFSPAATGRLSGAEIPFEAPVPWDIDPRRAINILTTGGGERYLYLGWKEGRSYLFYMDMEAEAAEEAFCAYGSLDDGWRELLDDEADRFDEDDEELEHVTVMRERADAS